jgi:hypothetical protein
MKWMRGFISALILGFAGFSGVAQAQQSCKLFNFVHEKQFNCSDGTIKKISILNEQLIVRTFNPETKVWNESRYPVAPGVSLDSINVSVMLNANEG